MTTSPGRTARATTGASSSEFSFEPPRIVLRQLVEQFGHVRTGGEHQIDLRLDEILGEAGMDLRRLVAEFQHVAEHRDAARTGGVGRPASLPTLASVAIAARIATGLAL